MMIGRKRSLYGLRRKPVRHTQHLRKVMNAWICLAYTHDVQDRLFGLARTCHPRELQPPYRIGAIETEIDPGKT